MSLAARASQVRTRIAQLVSLPERRRAVEGPHAQFGEDVVLDEIFAGRTAGYCAEVGAYDGRTGSATLLFEGRGWRCLLVEPNPGCVEQIRRNRACVVRHCAASSAEGEATFLVAEGVEQMSTVQTDEERRRAIAQSGGSVREITVRTARLDDLLDEAGFPELQFLTVDVEGHELAVLQGLSLDRFRPRIVILEENVLRRESAVSRHMSARGYVRFKRTGVNDWYARSDDGELVQPGALRRFERSRQIERAQHRAIDVVAKLVPESIKPRLASVNEWVRR